MEASPIPVGLHHHHRHQIDDHDISNVILPSAILQSDTGGAMTSLLSSSSAAAAKHRSTLEQKKFYSQFMTGLTVAGVASCLLVTIFGMFHVDVFLRVYELPLATYSFGSLVFAAINTINDFLAAWFLDSMASGSFHRSDIIGIAGCLFSICFLTPFYRWRTPSPKWDGVHFVVSMSLYDTMFSFMAILLGSLVTDNHHMSDSERVWFMASGKIANLITSFVVARTALEIFDEDNMSRFRAYIWALAFLSAILYSMAQILTRYIVDWNRFTFKRIKKPTSLEKKSVSRKLNLAQVARDFWGHKNFWAWIGMEIFLESQVSFANAFLKTFVDRLVHEEGVSRELCDWLLSSIRPLGLIAGIVCYIPIQQFGYRRVYPILFATNALLCLALLVTGTHQSTTHIVLFLIIYPTITEAVTSSGFHLVMSDMVLEMKKIHAMDGRLDEPSLAALYMGMNALFCKPAEAILPVIAANLMSHMNLHTEDNPEVQAALYKVLVLPPLAFSVLEWISWRNFTLTPQLTSQMREELKALHTPDDNDSDDWYQM